MELLYGYWRELQRWWFQVSSCFDRPIQTIECRPFWTLVMLGFFAIGVLVILAVIWKIISYKLKLAAALKAQADREHIDHAAIEGSRWNGEKAYSAELGGEEVERRIREVVNQRQLANASKRDKESIV